MTVGNLNPAGARMRSSASTSRRLSDLTFHPNFNLASSRTISETARRIGVLLPRESTIESEIARTIVARHRGIIGEANPLVNQLCNIGLYLSNEVIDEALSIIRE